jgi:hypothetical protein
MALYIIRASWAQQSDGFAQVETKDPGDAMAIALGLSHLDFELWDAQAMPVRITSVEEVPEDGEEESSVTPDVAASVIVLDDDGESD